MGKSVTPYTLRAKLIIANAIHRYMARSLIQIINEMGLVRDRRMHELTIKRPTHERVVLSRTHPNDLESR